jgi:tetrathionate reductase subunit B
MNRYELIIDSKACWGCLACEVACKQENQPPSGVKYISVQEKGAKAIDQKPELIYQVGVCCHCEEPECVEACPEEAIIKRQDGIVVLDQEKCSGCGVCLTACPYEAIEFDQSRTKAGKCNLCYHRVDKGLLPACADNICLARAIIFRVDSD